MGWGGPRGQGRMTPTDPPRLPCVQPAPEEPMELEAEQPPEAAQVVSIVE